MASRHDALESDQLASDVQGPDMTVAMQVKLQPCWIRASLASHKRQIDRIHS